MRMTVMLLPGQTTPDGIRCNTIIKRYGDGRARILAAERAIFRRPGFEKSDGAAGTEQAVTAPENPVERIEYEYAVTERRGIEADGGETAEEARRRRDNLARAQRRARTSVRDLALANPFRYFVTLTFDRQRVDRWNDREVLRVTRNWLDNHVRRDGLAYVLVAERHKDGAIHFHGFFNDALRGVDSGHRTSRGQVIYNLPGWGWGFTAAMEVYGEYAAAVSYVCKYITKGAEKVGGRWYYHGGDLRRPEVEYCNTEWEVVSENLDTITIDALGAEMVIMETEGCTK
jgi:hypothetical protein